MVKVYTPSPAIADYISSFWSIDTLSSAHTELVYPTGQIQLIFHYREPFLDRNSSGDEISQPEFSLCGQKLSYSSVTAGKNCGMIAAVLKTETASALLNIPLHEITGRIISFTDIYKSWKNYSWLFADSPDDISKIKIIESFLLRHIRIKSLHHSYFIKSCINEIRYTTGMSLPYKSLEKFSLSERSLQRIFKEGVGLSPKQFAEIVKFENCISLLQSGKSLTDICYEAGYYDQPHFIRAFKHFTGITPSQFSTLDCNMPVCRFYTIN